MLALLKRLPVKASAVAILFIVLQSVCALCLPYVTARIVDNGIVPGDIPSILSDGALMMALAVASLVAAVLGAYFVSRVSYEVGRDMRRDVYASVLRFSGKEFDDFGAATLITRSANDVAQVQNVVEMGLKFLILAPIYLVCGIVLTWLLNPALALVFIGALPFLALAAYVVFRFAGPLYGRMQELLDGLNLRFREGLTGARVMRAFCREQHEIERYGQTNEAYRATAVKAATIMSAFIPLVTLFMGLATAFIVWIGGGQIMAGEMQIGAVMGAITYAAQILMAFAILTSIIVLVPRAMVSARRVQEVIDHPVSVDDAEDAYAVACPQGKDLAFDHVGFRYAGADGRVLDDVSFSVQPGQTLAVVGGTGEGKTTLLNLIMRFADPEEGAVRLGGVDVRSCSLASVRAEVSIAPQRPMLFQGTIRSNLLMARPDATEEDLWEALHIAAADEFVRALPEGLDAVVDKAGGNFSGGQKQRLSIARALVKHASVYLFDDALSALDFKTEAVVRARLAPRVADAVCVVVSQRASAVLDADAIAVLDDGALVGFGRHEELIDGCDVYREIMHTQIQEEVAA